MMDKMLLLDYVTITNTIPLASTTPTPTTSDLTTWNSRIPMETATTLQFFITPQEYQCSHTIRFDSVDEGLITHNGL